MGKGDHHLNHVWTTGGTRDIIHKQVIGCGEFTEVHKVVFLRSALNLDAK